MNGSLRFVFSCNFKFETGLLTTAENTTPYHNLCVCHPKILHEHCFRFLLGVKMAPRETENNAYAKSWGDEQRALWYIMVFSVVVNSLHVTIANRVEWF